MKWQCNIKISTLWILVLPLICFTSFVSVYIHVLFMLFFHEWMHILMAFFFKVRVQQIIIYPFGMCAKFHGFGFGVPIQEGIIAMMGILSHGFIAFFLYLFLSLDLISNVYFQYLWDVNIGLALFNMIPIYPLDGFRIIQAFLHQIFPYRLAYHYMLICSIVFLFLNYRIWMMSISSFMIALLSLIMDIQMLIHRYQNIRNFYWYRYLHPFQGVVKYHRKDDIYRGYENYLFYQENFHHETKWLYEKLAKW